MVISCISNAGIDVHVFAFMCLSVLYLQLEVTEPGCAILRFSNNYICAGDTSGKVAAALPL